LKAKAEIQKAQGEINSQPISEKATVEQIKTEKKTTTTNNGSEAKVVN
jgi:hypothetical protein